MATPIEEAPSRTALFSLGRLTTNRRRDRENVYPIIFAENAHLRALVQHYKGTDAGYEERGI